MRRVLKYGNLLLWIGFGIWSCSSAHYDVVIKGGTVIDGSGSPGYRADIAISNSSIVKIGNIRESSGRMTVKAEGKYVVPGFIDIHTHCDNLQNPEYKAALNYLTQGVTTVVTGNCGSGTYKVAEFFRKLEEQGIGVNVVHLVGHGRVRSEVLLNADRAPTPAELEEMQALVEQAMTEGAAGMSSGLFYTPGGYAQTEEVIALLEPVERYGGIYATHLRDESNYTVGLLESIQEALLIGQKAGVPVQISHLKALGKPVWGLAPEVSNVIEEAIHHGVKIYADQYPYNASSTGLTAAVIPHWVQADGKLHDRLQDPRLLPRIRKEVEANIERRGGADTLVVASFSERPEWLGKSLKEISAILNKSEVDTAIELVLMGEPSIISFNMLDEDVEYFMQKTYVMTGSDGSAQIPGEALPHPRSYGTFPRKIRKYVLEKKLLTMEQAIRSATGLPTEMLGFSQRGLLKENYVADIIVFDPETIRDKATFTDPHQYSQGIDYVFIAGQMVIEAGEFTGTLAGKPLK
jgi:N-acyl-D-amino-acid deacylase